MVLSAPNPVCGGMLFRVPAVEVTSAAKETRLLVRVMIVPRRGHFPLSTPGVRLSLIAGAPWSGPFVGSITWQVPLVTLDCGLEELWEVLQQPLPPHKLLLGMQLMCLHLFPIALGLQQRLTRGGPLGSGVPG